MPKKTLGLKSFITVNYPQSDDDQIAKNALKRKKDIPTGNTNEEVEETDEALNMTQRLARSRSLKKNKSKIAMGRKKAARKIAGVDQLKKRAVKKARNTFLKKLTKDVPKNDLSFSRRQEIEKRLDKMKPKIDKLAAKLLPQVRKDELIKKRGGNKSD